MGITDVGIQKRIDAEQPSIDLLAVTHTNVNIGAAIETAVVVVAKAKLTKE
ncbi:hypothetical protein LTSEALA_2278 [Salmonella enterica subsp. enterica serovar Alachua str. R6-377]|uniref:Uncharacterized protein n=1 Tax=Salmonella enterica subsp. enterica serovar Alachua str. R6-377 TaxID=913241 RepID=G5LNP2_SALET|nr:hypothetical protein LTSEALA_2278 [Salmonella enterica subsp. enterica serovar Alachua str. R6-377]